MKILTPVGAARAFCLWCSKDAYEEVRECAAKECPLQALKDGKRPKGTRPRHLIKLKCFDCSGYARCEVIGCKHTDCPLWGFRSGKRQPIASPEPLPVQKTQWSSA